MKKEDKKYINDSIDASISKTLQEIGLIDIHAGIGNLCIIMQDQLQAQKEEHEKTRKMLGDMKNKLFVSDDENISIMESTRKIENTLKTHIENHKDAKVEKKYIITTLTAIIACLICVVGAFFLASYNNKPNLNNIKPVIKEMIKEIAKNGGV